MKEWCMILNGLMLIVMLLFMFWIVENFFCERIDMMFWGCFLGGIVF